MSNKLEFLSTEVLPQALGDLEGRHESIRELVQYLEDKYLIGKQKDDNLSVIEGEALTTVAETLSIVSNDVNIVAENLTEMLAIEMDTIESLTNRVKVATARMRLSEEQYARKKLSKVRSVKTTKMEHSEACKQIDGVASLENTTFERYSLKRRLTSRRDQVYDVLR
jgi:hypothetical protein